MAVSIADLLRSFDHIRFKKAPVTSAATGEPSEHRRLLKCPVCDSEMIVCAESVLPKAGARIELHEMECGSCGMMTERLFRPETGYDALAIAGLQELSRYRS